MKLQDRSVQIADLTTFLIRLLVKLTENSCMLSNEAFEMNEKMNNEVMRTSIQVKLENQLDSKFPFNMNKKSQI